MFPVLSRKMFTVFAENVYGFFAENVYGFFAENVYGFFRKMFTVFSGKCLRFFPDYFPTPRTRTDIRRPRKKTRQLLKML
jgi:hypothetical protein